MGSLCGEHWLKASQVEEERLTTMQTDWIKLGTEVVAICSVLHTILPPWEALNDFPTAQKYYKLLVFFIGYAALNGRSTVYPSLSTANGRQPSKAANGNAVQTAPAPVVNNVPDESLKGVK